MVMMEPTVAPAAERTNQEEVKQKAQPMVFQIINLENPTISGDVIYVLKTMYPVEMQTNLVTT